MEDIDKTNYTKGELLMRIRLLLSGHEYLKLKIDPSERVPISNNDYQKAY